MAFKHRYADGWYKNAAGLYVQSEPIDASLVAAASTGDVVTRKSDGTLYLAAPSGGSGGSGALTPDTPPDTPSAMDDEFDTGTAIDTGLWTARNVGSMTNSVERGALSLAIASGNAAVQQRGYEQTLPVASSWTFETKVTVDGDAGTSAEAGLWLVESGTGKILSLHVGYSGGNLIWTSRWNSVSSFGATINTVTPDPSPIRYWWYLRLVLSGSSYLCQYSRLGRKFTTLSTVALTTPFTTAADRIGVKAYNDSGSNNPIAVFEHFRRIA